MESPRTPSRSLAVTRPMVLGLLLLTFPMSLSAGSPAGDPAPSWAPSWPQLGAWLERVWGPGPAAAWEAFALGKGGDKGLGLDPDGGDPDPTDGGSDPPPPDGDTATDTTQEPPPTG